MLGEGFLVVLDGEGEIVELFVGRSYAAESPVIRMSVWGEDTDGELRHTWQ